MSVPKASVDEDCHILSRQYDVGRAGKVGGMAPEADSFGSEKPFDRLLRNGVLAPYQRHDGGALLAGENVRHLWLCDDSCGRNGDGSRIQGCNQRFGDSLGEQGWDGIPDLPCDLDLCPLEYEVVRETLEAGSFPVRDRSVLMRMQIAPLFRLEELRADGEGGPVPP